MAGESVAVKDLYDVAGLSVGAGNPARLAATTPAEADAPVVAALLAAGASLRGITQTDEFAYSLAGTNAHYGTPPNPAAPGRISGGSSSGSAAAVALGEASIGLGTDTGGSIRVPAAYQGLFGIRTTHGVLPRDGVLPLAPTFDAVGWLTRDAGLLARVGAVLVPGTTTAAGRKAWSPCRHCWSSPRSRWPRRSPAGSRGRCDRSAGRCRRLAGWRDAFVTLQAWEAWREHGTWLAERLGTLGPDVRGRFERARTIGADEAATARAVVDAARDTIREPGRRPGRRPARRLPRWPPCSATGWPRGCRRRGRRPSR
ncbi:amidase family protein [Nocardioides convexus]|uniref:amidase family protein n=1 Tax=Nocardioides convexus TaxID=2712224 RepID=UPI0024183EA5|nr:amidase family protein [Nocardioides convexus]